MKDVAKHSREQKSLLSGVERKALLWLAARMPGWLLPDHLTALGTVGAAMVLVGYLLSGIHRGYLWLAVAGFVINWFGDSLDGTVARYRKRERPHYGFFIDHTVDVVNEAMMFLAFGLSPYADFRTAACAFMSYMAVGQLVYINMIVSGVFRLSGAKVGPTETRIVGIAATVALFLFGSPVVRLPLFGAVTWVDAILVVVALFFTGLFIVIGGQIAADLARKEP